MVGSLTVVIVIVFEATLLLSNPDFMAIALIVVVFVISNGAL